MALFGGAIKAWDAEHGPAIDVESYPGGWRRRRPLTPSSAESTPTKKDRGRRTLSRAEKSVGTNLKFWVEGIR